MNSNKFSTKGIIVWFVCVLFFLYEFLLRTVIGTFQHSIMHDLELDAFQFALVSSSAFLCVYGVMQLAISPLLVRFGIKRSMLLAVSICALATLGFSGSTSYPAALLFRALMGFGAAFGFICVLVTIYDWIPYNSIGLFVGLSQFLGTMGPMAAGGPLNEIAQNSIITWRAMFVFLSIIGAILFILIGVFVDKNKTNIAPFTVLKLSSDIKKDIANLAKDSQIWFIVTFCAFIYFSLEYLSENECKNLMMAKGFSSDFAAYMITVSWLGFAVGSPLFGFISDKISRRKPILLFSSAFTVLSLTSIIYLPLTHLGMTVSFFTYGIAVGASSVGIVIMGEQFRAENVSTGLGLNNAVTILFVSLMAPCMSYLLAFFAQSEQFSLADFHRAFIVLIILPLISLMIGIFKIKETFGKSSKEPIVLNYKTLKNEIEN